LEAFILNRVALFIDGSNLYNGMKDNLTNTRVNLQELIKQLVGKRTLFRAYYYNAILTEDYDNELREGQMRFFESVRRIPYVSVQLGKLHKRTDGTLVEKGIDVAIAVDSLALAYEDAYDIAIIVSGDSDYLSLVEALQRKGKHVECAMFRTQSAGELMEYVDVFHKLDDLDWKSIIF
jgi:uncharacterized LabA/DUF88 family protein